MKAQIIVAVDQPDEMRSVEEWFARWKDRLVVVMHLVVTRTGIGRLIDFRVVGLLAAIVAPLGALRSCLERDLVAGHADQQADQLIGLVDVELANPVDTFAGAGGEESAREFGTLGYSIRASKPT